MQWHLRRVAMVWVGVRGLATIAFALSVAFAPAGTVKESPIAMATSPDAALLSIILVVLVAEIDSRRVGAPLLFANLGYSWRWSVATTAALAIGLEVLLQVLLRVVGTSK